MANREENEAVERALQGVRHGQEWLRAECPFCDAEGHRDRKRSLAVNAYTGRWKCLRCELWGYLSEPPDPNTEFEFQEREERDVEIVDPPEGFIPLWNDKSYTLRDAREYLKRRHIGSRKMARELQVGACVDGYWRNRVIVPLLNPQGEWLGWVGRVWLDRLPDYGVDSIPYLYPKGMPRGEFFWNHKALFEETDHPCLVVEGVFDATPYYPHVLASFGKPSHAQLDLLHTAQRPIVLALDGDSWEESWMHALQLRFGGKRAGFVRFPPKTDPDEVDPAWTWKEARRSLRKDDL